MNFRKLTIMMALAVALNFGLHAQSCTQIQAAGTYLSSFSGWATAATTPIPVFLPFVGVGLASVDETGSVTAASPLTSAVAGAANPLTLTASKVTVNSDCSVTAKFTCAEGCSWEAAGVFLKATKELHLVFTKADGYPLTATIEMKQVPR